MDDLLRTYGYVKSSTYRNKVLDTLYGDEVYKTPTQISYNVGIRTNHISKVLNDLKEKNLIQCINEDCKKGRLYCLTSYGKELCDFFIKQEGQIYSEVQ